MKIIIKSFLPVNKQYTLDLKEYMEYVLKTKDILLDEKKYKSKLLIKEYNKFYYYLSEEYKNDFLVSWGKSFIDPLMGYIIKYSSVDVLLTYVNNKYIFWNQFLSTNIYGFFLIVSNIFLGKIFFSLLNYKCIYFCYFLLCIVVIYCSFYIVLILSLFVIYKNFCEKYLYWQYFNNEISIEKLLKFLNINLNCFTKNLHKHGTLNRDIILHKLNIYWKVIFFLPKMIGFLVIMICLGFFFLELFRMISLFFLETNKFIA